MNHERVMNRRAISLSRLAPSLQAVCDRRALSLKFLALDRWIEGRIVDFSDRRQKIEICVWTVTRISGRVEDPNDGDKRDETHGLKKRAPSCLKRFVQITEPFLRDFSTGTPI